MPVVPGELRLFGDLVAEVWPGQPRLAAEARVRLHVVGAVEVVGLTVLHAVEGLEALLHPAVAGGAGADAAAGRAVVRAQLQRGLEERRSFRNLALRFPLAARGVDGDLGHVSRPLGAARRPP